MAVQRLIDRLARDYGEAERFEAALERHVRETGGEEPHAAVAKRIRDAAFTIKLGLFGARSRLYDDEDRARFSAREIENLDQARRTLHGALRRLPPALFADVVAEPGCPEREFVTKAERRQVPASPHLEDALLQLPAAWLKLVGFRLRVRGHRAKAPIAADVASWFYYAPRLNRWLEVCLTEGQRRLLADLVVVGRTPLSALSPEDRVSFIVPKDWRMPSVGNGGFLRQVGLAFIGRDGKRPTAYLPDGIRPALALALLEHERRPEVLEALESLAQAERDRRAREAPCCENEEAQLHRLPTRLGRIRRRTPGPDRIVELETTLETERGAVVRPVVTRRILISYQRSLGALREVIQLALGRFDGHSYLWAEGRDGDLSESWGDPRAMSLTDGIRNEWTTSIRDALAAHGGRLLHIDGPPPRLPPVTQHRIRRIRTHAPESVESEPRVIWGEGVAPARGEQTPPEPTPGQLNRILGAANVMLERLQA